MPTAALARELAIAETSPAQDESEVVNLAVGLSAGALKTVLADNLAHLVSQNMLEEGHSKEEAEAEVDTFLEILGLFSEVELTLSTDDDSLDVDFEIRMAE